MSKKLKKVDNPKPKFSFKKNILPPFVGIAVMLCVFGLLNSEYIAAQYVYRFVKPQIVNAQSLNTVPSSSESKILIPSLNVSSPIISEPSLVDSVVQNRLEQGVVHFGNIGEFGKFGNVIIVGHSSGAIWSPGQYKYVFTMLNKAKTGDRIIIDYKGTRYIYAVNSIKTVDPNNVEVLKQPKDKKIITLITCTPVGSNAKRLIVTGEQIVPKSSNTEPMAVEEDTDKVVPPSRITLPE